MQPRAVAGSIGIVVNVGTAGSGVGGEIVGRLVGLEFLEGVALAWCLAEVTVTVWLGMASLVWVNPIAMVAAAWV